jgi:hypothetical protein
MARTRVEGDLYFEIDGQLMEIKRQLRHPSGYRYDPSQLRKCLQAIIEGKFQKVPQVPPGPPVENLEFRRKVAVAYTRDIRSVIAEAAVVEAPNIIPYFPHIQRRLPKKDLERELVLLCFDRIMQVEEVEKEFRERGLVHAGAFELLHIWPMIRDELRVEAAFALGDQIPRECHDEDRAHEGVEIGRGTYRSKCLRIQWPYSETPGTGFLGMVPLK